MALRGSPARRFGTLVAVTDDPHDEGIRDRLSRQSEEALGKIVEELASNPIVTGAFSRALGAREKAAHAQEAAMGALGIPSAADVERVTRRLRSVSQRLEGIEDALDRIEERLSSLDTRVAERSTEEPLERRLEEIARELSSLREAVAPPGEPIPRAQERLTVTE
jgi:septal ring factor EnvC (AmiA/AmiB activator)